MFLAFVAGVSFATSAWNSSALTTQETFSDTTKRTMFFQIGTDFNFGFNGGPTDPTFAVDTVDRFGVNWRALRVPLETGRSYEDHIEPFFLLSFRAGYKNFYFLMEAPLRRILRRGTIPIQNLTPPTNRANWILPFL